MAPFRGVRQSVLNSLNKLIPGMVATGAFGGVATYVAARRSHSRLEVSGGSVTLPPSLSGSFSVTARQHNLTLPTTRYLERLEGQKPLYEEEQVVEVAEVEHGGKVSTLRATASCYMGQDRRRSREDTRAKLLLMQAEEQEEEETVEGAESGVVAEELTQLGGVIGPMGAADKLQLLLAELDIDENSDEAQAVSSALYDLLNDRKNQALPHRMGSLLKMFMTGFAMNSTLKENHAWIRESLQKQFSSLLSRTSSPNLA